MATHPHLRFAGYRYPAEVISTAVRLHFRFPLNLQMVEEMLAARSITVGYEPVRQRGLKFGRDIANALRRLPYRPSLSLRDLGRSRRPRLAT